MLALEEPKKSIPISGASVRRRRERQLVMTQDEFASKLGMSASAVRAIESGRRPSVYKSTFRAMADAFGLTLDQAREELTPQLDRNVDEYSERSVITAVPTFDLAVAAGHWVSVDETGEVSDAHQIDHGVFRIRIRGDSMTPRFKDGALVEFRCLRDGKHILEVGRFYYVQREGEATFKQLAEIDDEQLVFRALNKRKYPEKMPVERRSIVRMALALFVLDEA